MYRDNAAHMVRLGLALTGSRSAAEDIVQDTFARLVRFGQIPDQPVAYLRRAVINGTRNLARDGGRQAEVISAAAEQERIGPHAAPAADVELIASERALSVAAAILALPQRQREVATLYYLEDLAMSEIAVLAGISEDAVKGSCARARESLRRSLHEQLQS